MNADEMTTRTTTNNDENVAHEKLVFDTVLIANRGEVAVRLIKGCKALNLKAVAVYTPEDATALHVKLADIAVALDEGATYTSIESLVRIAKTTKAGAVLPGYGFVSEKPEAARAFENNDVIWVGPGADVIDLFGLKHAARKAAEEAGVPTIPGSPLVSNVEDAVQAAEKAGFPVLVKASAGGGGMGQAIARSTRDVPRAFESVIGQGESLFGSTEVYVERYIENARHIEVQVFGDGNGKVIALGDRDCSVQRRRQKVIEEGPAPGMDEETTTKIRNAAVDLCSAHNYRSAGTVEFIFDVDTTEWYFLEVNTRLQVEHGVTELVSGVDIVSWMLRQAGGVAVLEKEESAKSVPELGWSIEGRLYAENPVKDFAPSPGILSEMVWPQEGVDEKTGSVTRVDSWAERGTTISSSYDPLLGKILVWGRTRATAIGAFRSALRKTTAHGVPTNLELLKQIAENDAFVSGVYTTSLLSTVNIKSSTVEVMSPGLQTSLQDYPGRVGYWDIGVSPSGAMDAYAMNVSNALVGNPLGACALEITVRGPTLKFHAPAIVALCGAPFEAEIDDGRPAPWWTPFRVGRGSILSISSAGKEANESSDDVSQGKAKGKICYLAVRGGFDAPKYLGSSSTFPTGGFGGLTGGFLQAGDFLPLVPTAADSTPDDVVAGEEHGLSSGWPLSEPAPDWVIPKYSSEEWTVGALNGPHGSEDFLQASSLSEIWTAPYVVHHAANRLGVRLIGPTPKWTRTDGGSAGLHPSNLHDYTYAPGAVNLSGNTPIVLMLDGPSLGGFVCPVTVAASELWKVAQAPPGSTIRFKQVGYDDSRKAFSSMRNLWDALRERDTSRLRSLEAAGWTPGWIGDAQSADLPAIIALLDPARGDKAELKVTYRMSGDEHVLIEYGEIDLDLAYRMRVHMLMEELKPLDYVKELCPGVRSLLVRYNADKIHVARLIESLKELEEGVMGLVEDVVVPSRIIRLPLAFEDKWTVEAQQRYLRSVRPDAPYMPSNVEFVRRINGLDSVDEVKHIMTSSEYCVLGLGDVYLGAPCAVPLDPRHRLVTSKYNPARTYTPEGGVGIGGAYMCIYGMDSPGGYQLTGRTLPIWDNYGSVPQENRGAPPNIPWLLRFFDRVCFYSVTDDELEEMRAKYRRGSLKIDIQDDTLSYKDYLRFCRRNRDSIAAFRTKQQAAFDSERARWEASGEGESNAAAKHASRDTSEKAGAPAHGGTDEPDEAPIPFSVPVVAGVAASVWSVHFKDGDVVEKRQQLFTLESMKVEIAVEAPVGGVVCRIRVGKGDNVGANSELCVIKSSQKEAMSDLSLDQLRNAYKLGLLNPTVVVQGILDADAPRGVLVTKSSTETALRRVNELSALKPTTYLPLFGVPFVVSDDIDVEGFSSSSGCKHVSDPARVPAAIVRAMEDAGAVLIGKSNMDAFGTAVLGTETSYEVPVNPVSEELVCGGSAGAAVAVASKLASFAISVDTCGSAVTSAAACGVLALKTTEGLLSLEGIAPGCPGYDCLTITANSAADIRTVLKICAGIPRESHASLARLPEPGLPFPENRSPVRAFKVGCAVDDSLGLAESCPDGSTARAYREALQRLKVIGGQVGEIDATMLLEVSQSFGLSGLDAARFNALGEKVAGMENTDIPEYSRQKILAGGSLPASSLSSGLSQLRDALRWSEKAVWSEYDMLAIPTVPRVCTVEEANASAAEADAVMSQFTRIVTAMGLCALVLPAGSSGQKTPTSIMLLAPAFKEADLLDVADRW